MSQQTIGVGTSANDGTGDPLRTAMQKTNSNFTELYTADTANEKTANKDTDGTLAANSDAKYASQKATKTYVDNKVTTALAGIEWKASVLVATTSNITLSGEQTIDGVLTSASRVLVKDQSTGSQNGIYISASGSWARATDADSAAELEGATVNVEQGTSNGNTTWVQTADSITIGSTALVFSQLGTSVPDASGSTKGIAKLYTSVGTNTDGSMDQASIKAAIIGLQDLFVPASAMWPRVTNGCADLSKTEMVTSLVNIQTLDFDPDTQTYAQFGISLPTNWNNGTVTAKIYWMAATGSGDVKWQIKGGAYSDNDLFTTALGTAQSVTDTLLAASKLQITAATSAITLAGSPADSDMLFFEISRVAADGADTLTSNAKLIGVVITLTTDAAVAS